MALDRPHGFWSMIYRKGYVGKQSRPLRAIFFDGLNFVEGHQVIISALFSILIIELRRNNSSFFYGYIAETGHTPVTVMFLEKLFLLELNLEHQVFI